MARKDRRLGIRTPIEAAVAGRRSIRAPSGDRLSAVSPWRTSPPFAATNRRPVVPEMRRPLGDEAAAPCTFGSGVIGLVHRSQPSTRTSRIGQTSAPPSVVPDMARPAQSHVVGGIEAVVQPIAHILRVGGSKQPLWRRLMPKRKVQTLSCTTERTAGALHLSCSGMGARVRNDALARYPWLRRQQGEVRRVTAELRPASSADQIARLHLDPPVHLVDESVSDSMATMQSVPAIAGVSDMTSPRPTLVGSTGVDVPANIFSSIRPAWHRSHPIGRTRCPATLLEMLNGDLCVN